MEVVRLIYNNRWREGDVIDFSTEKVQDRAIETQRDTLSQQWRTANDTETAYIANNFGNAYEYNFVALLNHNIPNTATIKIIGADNAGFSSGVVQDTITWNAGDIYFFLSASRTKQYVKIEVTNPNNPDDYVQIATIVVGKYFVPNCNFEWGYDEGDMPQDEVTYMDSSLVAYYQERPTIWEGRFDFEPLNDESVEKIKEMNSQNQKLWALVVCFDYTAPNTSSHWVRLSSIENPIPIFINIWRWKMNIIQVL